MMNSLYNKIMNQFEAIVVTREKLKSEDPTTET